MARPRSNGSTRRVPIFALLGANAISWVGNIMTSVAVPWFVLETTGSAARTGLTGAAIGVGTVMAAFFGGPVVDRLGFKRTSVLADLMSGVTVALVPLLFWADALAFCQLLLLVFLGSVLDAPGRSAREATTSISLTSGSRCRASPRPRGCSSAWRSICWHSPPAQ